MHIQIHDQRDANFPVKIAGINIIDLYDTSTNMSFMSYACYVELKDIPSLKNVPVMSMYSATVHNLCTIALTCCEIMIGTSNFKHTFIVFKNV